MPRELKPEKGVTVVHSKTCASNPGKGQLRDISLCDCSPVYRADVWDNNAGKKITRRCRTITEARNWRTDVQAKLRLNPTVRDSSHLGTISEQLDRVVEGMRDGTVLDRSGRAYRPATIRGYERDSQQHLKPEIGSQRFVSLHVRDVNRMIDKWHRAGLSGSTIRNRLDPLRVAYRRAHQDGLIATNPTIGVRLPALKTASRRVRDLDRVRELLDRLPMPDRAAWALMFYAGLRIGEVRALTWQVIDLDQRVVHVHGGWDDVAGEQETKTAAGVRTVPLAGLVLDLLRELPSSPGLVFARPDGTAFSRTTFRSRAYQAWGWKRNRRGEKGSHWLQQEGCLDPLSPHEARHCAASYMAAAGLSPKEAQTALGHADIRTTMNIYAKAVPGWESGAAAKLDAFLAPAI